MKTKSSARDRDDYAQNVSKRHKLVGLILNQGYFRAYKVFQEVPISEINPNYHNNKTKADWYIPSLHIVIEVNGEQHYEPVDFGGEGMAKAKLRFVRGQHLDVEKHLALAEVGVGVVEISPDDTIDEETLLAMVSDVMKRMTVPASSRFRKGSQKQEKFKEQARTNRREYYQKMKQRVQEERE